MFESGRSSNTVGQCGNIRFPTGSSILKWQSVKVTGVQNRAKISHILTP